jgi:stearoyl-CoA desaturase (delta-9 desaturase)
VTVLTTEPLTRSSSNPPSTSEAPEPVSLAIQATTLTAVIVPFVGLLVALCLLWGYGFGWVEGALLLSMYCLTAVGITVGYHRLFAHQSFRTNRVIQFILAVLGSMAVQGPLFRWVANHRIHHQHSDKPRDPHSPHQAGRGFRGLVVGLWHAHLGWLFQPTPPNLPRYVKDLLRSSTLRTASALFPLWVVIGLLIPTVLGGLLTMSWLGAVLGLLWGGLVRIFLVHHVTWSVNSVCHLWGRQPYKVEDHSKNNAVFGVLALGEGWHNNHHAFPSSAKHGFQWWQLDASYWIIRVLALLGLAWKVRLPTKQAIGSWGKPQLTFSNESAT